MRRAKGFHAWLLLWKATRAVEAYAHLSIASAGLCLSDFAVLEALLHKGPLPVSALGQLVLLTSGSTTAAVDRLERLSLVKRTAVVSDRRSRIVSLTAAGSKLIREIFANHSREMERAFSLLSDSEINAFVDTLRILGHKAEELTAVQEVGSAVPPRQNKKGRK